MNWKSLQTVRIVMGSPDNLQKGCLLYPAQPSGMIVVGRTGTGQSPAILRWLAQLSNFKRSTARKRNGKSAPMFKVTTRMVDLKHLADWTRSCLWCFTCRPHTTWPMELSNDLHASISPPHCQPQSVSHTDLCRWLLNTHGVTAWLQIGSRHTVLNISSHHHGKQMSFQHLAWLRKLKKNYIT